SAPASTLGTSAHPVPTGSAGASPAAEALPVATSVDAAPSTAPHAVETNADAHLLAIEHALTAGERFLVHAMVARMSHEEREVLLDKLLSASVPDGAAIFRAAIHELTVRMQSVEAAPVAGGSALDERQRLDAKTPDDPGALDEQPEEAEPED